MSRPVPELVLLGQVVIEATAGGLRTADALLLGGGRVLAAGPRDEILAAAGGARRMAFGEAAIVPGLNDFHLHLVGMARVRRELRLDGMDGGALFGVVAAAAGALPRGAWLRGRGWSETALDPAVAARLNAALADAPALLYSHDAHSAWASPAALAAAGVRETTPDPSGGRIDRDAAGIPTGVLRENATDLVERVAGRLRGPELEAALEETLAELAGWGVTGATDAGDTTPENGTGRYAALGDRASLLLEAAPMLDGRLRLRIGVPAGAIEAAAELGLQTGALIPEAAALRAGWAKAYADGALGSRTAALFAPYTCGDAGDVGILRLQPPELDGLLAAGRRLGIGLAVHAIGDRAAAAVLDAVARAPVRRDGTPPDRIEHLQLLRPEDRGRLAGANVTASVQPVHCPADRELVETCWADRADLTYPWRSLQRAGTRLAFGSDGPIETANPWIGLHAAVHRRYPGQAGPDWHPEEALDVTSALAGYTTGPAAASLASDEGHLRPGALADLAVLNVPLATLLSADERLAEVRSLLTLVGGREVHRS